MSKARLFLALGSLASTLFGLVHCGDDATDPAADAGSPEASADATSDASRTDGSTVVEDAGAASARAFAMNGIVTVDSPIRFCFLASKVGPPTLADGVNTPAIPAAGVTPGALTPTGLPSELVDSNVRIVVYYEESLSAFGVSNKTCKELAAMSALAVGTDAGTPDAGEPDASIDDAGDPDAADADVADAADDADASDPVDAAIDVDAAAAAAVPLGGGTGGLQLVQYADFDISDEIIAAGAIKADSSYLLYASGCTHRQVPSHSTTFCNNDQTFGPEPYKDFYAWLIRLDTTSAAPPEGQSRVQVVLGDDIWRLSGMFNHQAVGVTYGDASVPIQGPGNPANPDGGATFPYVVASQPAHPGTLVPTITNATAFYFVPPEFPAQVFSTNDVLELSGLTPADLSSPSTFTLVPMGNGVDEVERLPDGKLNPRYLGFRIIRNK